MKNKYFETAAKKLKDKYMIDVTDDILLGSNNRMLLYANISHPEQIKLHVISGSLDRMGFDDKPTILLSEIISKIDLDNKFSEVAGKNEYLSYLYSQLYNFSSEIGFSIPVKIENSIRWLNFVITKIEDHPELRVFVVTDISEIMKEEELNYEKTHKDPLTHLFNKYTFDYHYGLRYKFENLHVLYLDIDNFKQVNDGFGHNIGNQFLIGFAKILRSFENEYNIFYRLGGDEFVGLFFKSENEIRNIAENILEKARALQIESIPHHITVSIGIVKSTLGEDLVRKADDVLYEVKQSGKNNYKYVVEK